MRGASRLRTSLPQTAASRGFNTLAAGVLCNTADPKRVVQTSYYSPEPGKHPHWQKARRVELSPLNIIPLETLDQMSPERFRGLRTRLARGEEPEMVRRIEEQIANTMRHPLTPPRWEGQVFRYALNGPLGSPARLGPGAPIIVRGIPVTLDQNEVDWDNAQAISVIEALYRDGEQGLAPVEISPEQRHEGTAGRRVKHPRFAITPGKGTSPVPSILPVERIFLTFEMEGESKLRQTGAEIAMRTGNGGERNVLYIPGALEPEEMTDAMLRAYAGHGQEGGEDASPEEADRQAAELRREIRTEVEAVLEDHAGAYAKKLQEAADNFTCNINPPERPVTVTSKDGLITITSNPPSERKHAGWPSAER